MREENKLNLPNVTSKVEHTMSNDTVSRLNFGVIIMVSNISPQKVPVSDFYTVKTNNRAYFSNMAITLTFKLENKSYPRTIQLKLALILIILTDKQSHYDNKE